MYVCMCVCMCVCVYVFYHVTKSAKDVAACVDEVHDISCLIQVVRTVLRRVLPYLYLVCKVYSRGD